MGDDAILALVCGRGRDDDHLSLGLGQVPGLLHQRVVIGGKGPELVRSVGEHEKDVGDKSRLLLYGEDTVSDVLGHLGEIGDREAADGTCVSHDCGSFGITPSLDCLQYRVAHDRVLVSCRKREGSA